MTTTEHVLRVDAKLASAIRHHGTAVVTFFARGDDDVLEALANAAGSDCIVGVVLVREVATTNGSTSE